MANLNNRKSRKRVQNKSPKLQYSKGKKTMNVQVPSQKIYEYPSTSYIESIQKQRFKTLNQAINLIHKAPSSEGRREDRYKLKNFDGKNAHLFQCWKEDCKSYIVLKSFLNSRPTSTNKVQFEIHQISNVHDHKNQEPLLGSIEELNKAKKSPLISNESECDNNQIDKFQLIKHRLRKHNILNYFRDYVNYFSSAKGQNPNSNLPFRLPQFLISKPFQVTLKICYKCLNEKKKTYFFVIQVFAFGDLYTQVNFTTCLKTKNPEVYLYTLTLIYIMFNSIQNCTILMEKEQLRLIRRLRAKVSQLLTERKGDQDSFLLFLCNLEKQFFVAAEEVKMVRVNNQGHFQRHYVQQSQRQYDQRKHVLPDSEEHSKNSIISTEEQGKEQGQSRSFKRSYIKFHQLQSKQSRSIKNKCLIAQSTYKEATIGKNGQWHVCEDKPSLIQKINDSFRIKQINRWKKQKNKEEKYCKDANFIELSDDDSRDQKVEQKKTMNKQYVLQQQRNYLNYLLPEVFEFRQLEDKSKEKQGKQYQQKFQLINYLEQKEPKSQKRNPLNAEKMKEQFIFIHQRPTTFRKVPSSYSSQLFNQSISSHQSMKDSQQ